MKKQMLLCMAALSFSAVSAQTYETRFARPLSDVLNDVAQVKKFNALKKALESTPLIIKSQLI